MLAAHGVATEILPLMRSGEVDFDYHRQWMETRQMVESVKNGIEEDKPAHDIFRCDGQAQSNDVLLGRGKGALFHPGNIQFRKMIDSYADAYDQADKKEKTRITNEIVYAVKKFGRFLDADGAEGWKEANDKTARLKVSHAFRTRRAMARPNKRRTKVLQASQSTAIASDIEPIPFTNGTDERNVDDPFSAKELLLWLRF